MHMLMLPFLSIIKSSLEAFLLPLHNECSVQKYKETKAKTQVVCRRSSMLSFDEAQREREYAYVAMTKRMSSAVILMMFLDHCVLEVFCVMWTKKLS